MDRLRAGSPVYGRQRSRSSTGSTSPGGVSPSHHCSSSTSSAASVPGVGVGAGISNVRHTQNVATRTEAARLTQVMASQSAAAANGDDEEEDDYANDHPPPPTIRFGSGPRAGHGSNGVSLLGHTVGSPSCGKFAPGSLDGLARRCVSASGSAGREAAAQSDLAVESLNPVVGAPDPTSLVPDLAMDAVI